MGDKYSLKRARVHGAIYVEVIISLILFIALIGAIVTMAIAVYRYLIIIDTSTVVLRQIAIDPAMRMSGTTLTTCAAMNDKIEDRIREYMKNTFNIHTGDTQVSLDSSDPPQIRSNRLAHPNCTAAVFGTIKYKVPCPFCNWFKVKPEVKVTSRVTIEDPDFLYCGTVCQECPVF